MSSRPAMKAHFILYVKDQSQSTTFYRYVLACEPTLDVPGMAEFSLAQDTLLGLMPVAGIQRLLGKKLPSPALAAGIPRTELYLLVSRPQEYHQRALEAGAVELSPLQDRDWGHRAAYSLDPDGHVLAFAEVI